MRSLTQPQGTGRGMDMAVTKGSKVLISWSSYPSERRQTLFNH